MSIIYHLSTRKFLPRFKGKFDCKCEAKNKLKEILRRSPRDLTASEISASVTLLAINESKIPLLDRMYLSRKEDEEPVEVPDRYLDQKDTLEKDEDDIN